MFVLATKTVPVPGTAVPLSATSLKVSQVFMQVKSSNQGCIYYGDSTVDSTTGIRLEVPLAGAKLPDVNIVPTGENNAMDLSQIYIDAQQANEGVNIFYERY